MLASPKRIIPFLHQIAGEPGKTLLIKYITLRLTINPHSTVDMILVLAWTFHCMIREWKH